MDIATETILYFRYNKINRENIEDFSLYLYGMEGIDYKLRNGYKIFDNGDVVPTDYPLTMGDIISFF